jgi:hypothetical protein
MEGWLQLAAVCALRTCSNCIPERTKQAPAGGGWGGGREGGGDSEGHGGARLIGLLLQLVDCGFGALGHAGVFEMKQRVDA